MKMKLFYEWLEKYSRIKDTNSIPNMKLIFEKCPHIDAILARAIKEEMDLADIEVLITDDYPKTVPAEPAKVQASKKFNPKTWLKGKFKKDDRVTIVVEPVTVNVDSVPAKDSPKVSPSNRPAVPEVALDEYGNPVDGQQGTFIEDDDEPVEGATVVNDERYVGTGKVKAKPAKKSSLLQTGVVIGFLVLSAMLVMLFMFLGKAPTPPPQTIPIDPTATVPVGITDSPPASNLWFMQALQNGKAFLLKPESWTDLLTNSSKYWFWIFFVLPIPAILSLLREDRLAAREKTDLLLVSIGLICLFVFFVLAEVYVGISKWAGKDIPGLSPYVVYGIGFCLNIMAQTGATITGKRDYSALAIAGLFLTGVIIVWWWPTKLFAQILGVCLMFSGMILQAFEMNRTHQGNKALLMSFIMLALFGVTMGLFYWTSAFIANVNPPQNNWAVIYGLFLRIVYSNRLLIGGVLGLSVAYGIGSQWASLLLNVVKPSARETDQFVDQGDRSSRDDQTARFDAMVFGIMLLYPISFVIFEVSKLFR